MTTVQNLAVQNSARPAPGEVSRIVARCADVIATDGLIRAWVRNPPDWDALAALARFDAAAAGPTCPHARTRMGLGCIVAECQLHWAAVTRRVPAALLARPWLGPHLAAVRLAPRDGGGRLVWVSVGSRAEAVARCRAEGLAGEGDAPNALVEYSPERRCYALAWATPDARGQGGKIVANSIDIDLGGA